MPSWAWSDGYVIDGRAAGTATPDQMRAMLQSLLADRFRLRLRREWRTMPVYELVTADGGLKVAPAKAGEALVQIIAAALVDARQLAHAIRPNLRSDG